MDNISIKYFNEYVEYLKESKGVTDDNINIILFSNKNEDSSSGTLDFFNKEVNKNTKLKLYVIDITECILKNVNNNDFLISDSLNKKIKINNDNTVILCRRGILTNSYTQDIVEVLENNKFFIINSLQSIIDCENKYTTTKILQANGIPTPKTVIIQNEDQILGSVEKIGGNYPIILKLLKGTQGIGVSIVDSEASLRSVLQTIWKIDSHTEIIMQEKIEADYDLRIHVLNKKFNSPHMSDDDSILLGYMKRNRIDKDFRTNYSLGGTVDKVKLTKEQEEIAIKSAKVLGCIWCGVDIIVDKKTGKNYVLEVNASPGTKGLMKATGVNVVKSIIDFAKEKQNWTRKNKVIGYLEVLEIPKIGEIIAKFDTGNGSLSSSLTCDKFTVSDDKKTLKWELNNKKFTNEIVGKSETLIGDKLHFRYVINIDIIFAGKLYKNVDISLVDRSDKTTKFLANRKFMERIGCSINPNKTFVITESPANYSSKEAKNNPYHGIKFK